MVDEDGDEALSISGASEEAVAQLAFDHGIVLYEIAAQSASLERVFLELTTTPAEEVVR